MLAVALGARPAREHHIGTLAGPLEIPERLNTTAEAVLRRVEAAMYATETGRRPDELNAPRADLTPLSARYRTLPRACVV